MTPADSWRDGRLYELARSEWVGEEIIIVERLDEGDFVFLRLTKREGQEAHEVRESHILLDAEQARWLTSALDTHAL